MRKTPISSPQIILRRQGKKSDQRKKSPDIEPLRKNTQKTKPTKHIPTIYNRYATHFSNKVMFRNFIIESIASLLRRVPDSSIAFSAFRIHACPCAPAAVILFLGFFVRHLSMKSRHSVETSFQTFEGVSGEGRRECLSDKTHPTLSRKRGLVRGFVYQISEQ